MVCRPSITNRHALVNTTFSWNETIVLSLPAPWRLRAPSAADQPFLDALYRASRSDLASMPVDPAFLDQLIKLQQHAQTSGLRHTYPQAAYYIIEDNAAPIGRLVIDTAAEHAHLLDLALMPAARGQGCGGAVLRALQASAAERKHALWLSVSVSNPAARRLYARLGFVSTASDGVQESMAWRP